MLDTLEYILLSDDYKNPRLIFGSIGIAVLVWLTYYILSVIHEGFFSKLPPGPLPLPLIGNAHLLGDKPHLEFCRLARKYGPVYKLRLGRQLVVVINDLALIKEASRGSDFAGRAKSISGEFFSGHGKSIGFQTYSEQWRGQHKALTIAIRHCEGKQGPLEATVADEVEKLLGRLAKQADSTFDPRLDLGLLVTNVFSRVIFGRIFKKEDGEFQSLLQQTLNFSEGLAAANFLDAFPFLQVFPFPVIKKMRETASRRDEIFLSQHQLHQVTFKEGRIRDIADALIQAEKDENQNIGSRPDADLPRSLDGLKRMYTLNESIIAGIESPLTCIMWTVALLAKYPDVQAKLQKSIDDIIGRSHVLLTYQDRSKFPYVEAVIYEALRLATVLPVAIPHFTMADAKLAGYEIPKDTIAFFNLWNVHHDPGLWENPYEFKPDRLIDSKGEVITAGLLPFSLGTRSCPWEVSSRKMLFVLFANLCHQFTFTHAQGCPLPEVKDCRFGITLSPPSYKVKVNKRL
ncbi:predicted protein [Nematostella vectensis]|uniref:Unspecific monooxygenase n=1 Tax=Nematostella vectensis TaxID=45351 RepID=A7RHE7_NEMVE|nr:predicted protein [Nematostella vectensis]|eukprot:XP_001641277.1 predicted protein [Nematostella vectensis]